MIKWETERPAHDLQAPCHFLVIGGVLCRWWGEKEPEGARLLELVANAPRLAINSATLRHHSGRMIEIIRSGQGSQAANDQARATLECYIADLMIGLSKYAVSEHTIAQEKQEPTVATVRDQYRMAALTGLLAGHQGENLERIEELAVDYGDITFERRVK